MVLKSICQRIVIALLLVLVLLSPGLSAGSAGADEAGGRIDPALQRLMAQDPSRLLPIIVQMAVPKGKPPARGAGSQQAQRALQLLDQLGPDAARIGALPLIDGAAGAANARAINALAANPTVAYVYEDAVVRRRSGTTTTVSQLATAYPVEVRATKAWQDGVTGKGVTVAVLDSGIAPSTDLTQPANRLLAAVNFAGDLGGMPDAGGHGTHVAGIIAGNSTGTNLANRTVEAMLSGDLTQADYVGIAPGSNVVDVRVLNGYGSGRISGVVSGIQWVLQNKATYNIRVANLSFGAPISSSYRQDPLSSAVEAAWKRGVVVVAAAGNRGPGSGSVGTPGIDPYVVTVGGVEDQATASVLDDVWASFTSWGTPSGSTPKPDLVAPGRRIASLRVPGSYLDVTYPDRVVTGRIGPNYFRLTGTSMSAAVVSGAVALMLERQPGLTPDQVKAMLVATAQPYGQNSSILPPDPSADGRGLLNAYAAITSSPLSGANRGLRPADGFARMLYPVLYGQPLSWKDPSYAGVDWNNLAWDNLAWDNLAWDNLAWDNLGWDNLAWDNLAWDNLAWDNLAWDNLAWDRGQNGEDLD